MFVHHKWYHNRTKENETKQKKTTNKIKLNIITQPQQTLNKKKKKEKTIQTIYIDIYLLYYELYNTHVLRVILNNLLSYGRVESRI